MQTDVALIKCSDYEPGQIKAAVKQLVDSLGGMGQFVAKGDAVLLKPNLLAPALPEKAVTTHPEVVRAVAELVIDAGGKPFIADSPGVSSFSKVADKSGMGKVAGELGIKLFALGDSRPYRQGEKKIFRIFEISSQVMEADVVINIPKLKTHTQMFMTMGVKNMFGCVVGKRKPQWHLRAGIDRDFFARMLVELYHAISPSLTVMDGVTAMEGDGPGKAGRAFHLGALAASRDAVALDRVMLELVGAKPELLYTNRVAAEIGIGESDLSRIKVIGEPLRNMRVSGFELPKSAIDLVPLPKIFRSVMTNQLTAKPREERDKCTLCDICIDICPTDVISKLGGRLGFNYDKCLRCYCCVEVCPEGALKPHLPWLLRMVS